MRSLCARRDRAIRFAVSNETSPADSTQAGAPAARSKLQLLVSRPAIAPGRGRIPARSGSIQMPVEAAAIREMRAATREMRRSVKCVRQRQCAYSKRGIALSVFFVALTRTILRSPSRSGSRSQHHAYRRPRTCCCERWCNEQVDLGCFVHETGRLEPIGNPLEPKRSMSPARHEPLLMQPE